MTACGIIAEYNPFHNGHLRHIQQAKAVTGAEYVVVVMSGNFVQRGGPAVCQKFSRAKMALLNGADIVIELPVFFAAASAEYFAMAAVKLLDDVGVDYICFGSESGDLAALRQTAAVLQAEPESFKRELKQGLNAGLSFPKARGMALKNAVVSEPNDILGVEYIKALNALNSKIKPFAVKRDGAHEHCLEFDGNAASASAIRKMILGGLGEPGVPAKSRLKVATEVASAASDFSRNLQPTSVGTPTPCISNVMPPNAYKILQDEISAGRFNCEDNFSDILHYALAAATAEQLHETADIREGLENRILAAASGTVTQTATAAKTKRYTLTRVYRAIFNIILSIRQSELAFYTATGYSRYARVLGFRKNSNALLGNMCDTAKVPVITNLKKAMSALDRPALVMLEKELQATNIYYAPLKNKSQITPELSTPIVIV